MMIESLKYDLPSLEQLFTNKFNEIELLDGVWPMMTLAAITKNMRSVGSFHVCVSSTQLIFHSDVAFIDSFVENNE